MRRSALVALGALSFLGLVGISCGGGSSTDANNAATGVTGGAAGTSSTGSSGSSTGGSQNSNTDASVGSTGGAANTTGSAGSDPGTGGTPGAGGGGALTDANQASDVTCALANAFESFGIMVAHPTSDAAPSAEAGACGTKANPCTTVQAGIDAAAAGAKQYVYVASGTYNEDNVKLVKGVTLTGGWNTADWTRGCPIDAGLTTIRNVSGDRVIAAVDLGGSAGIDSITLKSKVQSAVAAGESIYGVFAKGATTTLSLKNVKISLVNGGAGGPGGAGAAPAAAAAAGACLAEGANPGQPGLSGGNGVGATPAVFGPDGFAPKVGEDGKSGGVGGPGAITKAPDTSAYCGSCSGCFENSTLDCQNSWAYVTKTATAGKIGCGGGGGGGGGGGKGGGSSIAVYVADAHVDIVASSLGAGDGGKGGDGVTGIPGGAPSAGVTGGGVSCYSSCTGAYNFLQCPIILTAIAQQAEEQANLEAQAAIDTGAGGAPNEDPAIGGAAATVIGAGGTIIVILPCIGKNGCYSCSGTGNVSTLAGGVGTSGVAGGPGGIGGGGSGGSSFAIAKVGAAMVGTSADTTMAHGILGNGGAGANKGADGSAGNVYE